MASAAVPGRSFNLFHHIIFFLILQMTNKKRPPYGISSHMAASTYSFSFNRIPNEFSLEEKPEFLSADSDAVAAVKPLRALKSVSI